MEILFCGSFIESELVPVQIALASQANCFCLLDILVSCGVAGCRGHCPWNALACVNGWSKRPKIFA